MKYILALIIGLSFSNVAQAGHESVCKATVQYEELIDFAEESRGETVAETIVLNDKLVIAILKAQPPKDNWTIALVNSDGIACILSFSKMETSEES